MQVKKASVPIFHVHLSNLEATAALHAMRVVTSSVRSRGVPSNPYEAAALAFSKSFETLLMEQGAKNQLAEVEEKYSSKKIPKVQDHTKKQEEILEEEEDLQSLIAQDSELVG